MIKQINHSPYHQAAGFCPLPDFFSYFAMCPIIQTVITQHLLRELEMHGEIVLEFYKNIQTGIDKHV